MDLVDIECISHGPNAAIGISFPLHPEPPQGFEGSRYCVTYTALTLWLLGLGEGCGTETGTDNGVLFLPRFNYPHPDSSVTKGLACRLNSLDEGIYHNG